jgi:hypothetical protein
MPVTQPGVADQFIKDVKESAEKILKNPKKKTTGGVSILKSAYDTKFHAIFFLFHCKDHLK